jgi:hypothetical protein
MFRAENSSPQPMLAIRVARGLKVRVDARAALS